MAVKASDILTTGEVAKICSVSRGTVVQWFDLGRLKGYRIPRSKTRKIPKAQLIRFMRAHGISTDEIEPGNRILVVDNYPIYKNLRHADFDYEIKCTLNPWEAGLLLERWHPVVIIVNLDLEAIRPGDVLSLRQYDGMRNVKIIAIVKTFAKEDRKRLMLDGFDKVLEPGFSFRQLVCELEKIQEE